MCWIINTLPVLYWRGVWSQWGWFCDRIFKKIQVLHAKKLCLWTLYTTGQVRNEFFHLKRNSFNFVAISNKYLLELHISSAFELIKSHLDKHKNLTNDFWPKLHIYLSVPVYFIKINRTNSELCCLKIYHTWQISILRKWHLKLNFKISWHYWLFHELYSLH